MVRRRQPTPPATPPPPPPTTWPEPATTPLRRLLALWPVLTALATGAVGTWGWMETKLQGRIDTAVHAHDSPQHEPPAHPAVDKRLVELESHEKTHLRDYVALRTRVSLCEDGLREAYWWLVGDKAAERERDKRRASQAAREARERFLRYVHEGQSLDDAYRHALPSSVPGW